MPVPVSPGYKPSLLLRERASVRSKHSGLGPEVPRAHCYPPSEKLAHSAALRSTFVVPACNQPRVHVRLAPTPGLGTDVLRARCPPPSRAAGLARTCTHHHPRRAVTWRKLGNRIPSRHTLALGSRWRQPDPPLKPSRNTVGDSAVPVPQPQHRGLSATGLPISSSFGRPARTAVVSSRRFYSHLKRPGVVLHWSPGLEDQTRPRHLSVLTVHVG